MIWFQLVGLAGEPVWVAKSLPVFALTSINLNLRSTSFALGRRHFLDRFLFVSSFPFLSSRFISFQFISFRFAKRSAYTMKQTNGLQLEWIQLEWHDKQKS